jgi:1-acyl-sn-glycerol-3-phosphate acyltransferase
MASISGRLEIAGRLLGCIAAGVPSTALIPLPLSLALTRRYRREELLKRLHLMVPWARFCRKHILKIDLHVEGAANRPVPSRGHMYVSNHQSWVDILILMEALDTVAFLSKTLVQRIPVIGRCAYAGGTIYVSRKNGESRQRALRQTLRMCQESTAVVIFPEGTRSTDGQLKQKIHKASIKAAFDHGLRVIPVGIDGTYRVVPKSMDRVNLGQRVVVTLGEEMVPADFPDADAWADAVWRRVTQAFEESRARLS